MNPYGEVDLNPIIRGTEGVEVFSEKPGQHQLTHLHNWL